MRLPPSWRLVGKGARPAGWPGARPRVYGMLLGVVAVGAACTRVRAAVVAWGGRGLGAAGLLGCSSVSVARSWCLGEVRQTLQQGAIH